jgi:hypothetical protein
MEQHLLQDVAGKRGVGDHRAHVALQPNPRMPDQLLERVTIARLRAQYEKFVHPIRKSERVRRASCCASGFALKSDGVYRSFQWPLML